MEVQQMREVERDNKSKKTFNFSLLNKTQKSCKTGTFVDDEGLCLTLSGDSWESVDLDYAVNKDTVLTFEYRSEKEPELSLIVFDSNRQSPDASPFFKINGCLPCKDSSNGGIAGYDGNGEWQKLTLPVGQYFKGHYSKIVFANDDDRRGMKGCASFKNVEIFDVLEESPVEASLNEVPEDFSGSDDVVVEVSESIACPENPFLPRCGNKHLAVQGKENIYVRASGVIRKLKNKTYFVESVAVSGMTAGLSDSFNTLFKMFSVENGQEIIESEGLLNWSFEGLSQKFKYLSAGEVLTLAYTIAVEYEPYFEKQEVVINVVGTKDIPLVLQKVITSGTTSDLQIKNIFNSVSQNKIIDSESLSLTITGPMRNEFIFELDVNTESFSFNPAQFSYLSESEIIQFELNLDGDDQNESRTEVFSAVIIGHKNSLPSIIFFQNSNDKKTLFSFVEFSVIETQGKVLADALAVPEKHIDSVIFTLGECHLDFENRILFEPELDINDNDKLFTQSTKVDFTDADLMNESDHYSSVNDLKVI